MWCLKGCAAQCSKQHGAADQSLCFVHMNDRVYGGTLLYAWTWSASVWSVLAF